MHKTSVLKGHKPISATIVLANLNSSLSHLWQKRDSTV